MKAIHFLRSGIILAGILLGACAAPVSTPAPASGGVDKALYSEVVFTGVIESMSADQWVINGQTIQVDQSVIRDGSFVVGDTVKVEAVVAADGSITAQRVESPAAADLAGIATSTPDVSSTSVPGGLVFDASGTEAVGTVESITATSITIGGQTFLFGPGVEIKGIFGPGAVVKLHFTVNADGTLSVREIESADPARTGNDNSSGDNSNNSNSNSRNSNGNSNDSNGNDNSNDDHGGNSNDNDSDDDDDDNSNDNNNG